MADAAILAAGGGNAPLSYLVPGSTAIRIKQIHVQYVNNGAGADWLPAVQIISDSKHTMGVAADQAVKVTAGSDADVSFFPGVKPAAAATSLSSQIARAWGLNFNPQSVNAGATKNASFDTVRTSDATQILWSTTTVLNDTFKIMTTGWAQIVASCQWPAGTLVDYRIDSPGGFELLQHDAVTAFSKQGTDFTVGLPTMMDSVWIDSTAGAGTQFRVKMTNNDGVASGPDTVMVAIMFYPGLSL
jgi:hypothetical protein